MKLRIKGNTIRLRLSQQEVAGVVEQGRVESSINFGNKELVYALNSVEVSEIFTEFKNDAINVFAPKATVLEWAEGNATGFERNVQINQDNAVFVLVEKDYQCLTERPNEDESDLFKNPLEKHTDEQC